MLVSPVIVAFGELTGKLEWSGLILGGMRFGKKMKSLGNLETRRWFSPPSPGKLTDTKRPMLYFSVFQIHLPINVDYFSPKARKEETLSIPFKEVCLYCEILNFGSMTYFMNLGNFYYYFVFSFSVFNMININILLNSLCVWKETLHTTNIHISM